MLQLSNLKGPAGGRKNRKRVGRGIGSGTGKTSGKGQKGQNSRSGGGVRPWFEGGQMPLHRRLPKRGIDPVTPEVMKDKGLIKKVGAVKILGVGELKESLSVHAHKFSKSAQAKIEKSGGKAVNL